MDNEEAPLLMSLWMPFGRPPKVKPCSFPLWASALDVGGEPTRTPASSSVRPTCSSCVPSSAMYDSGREPGRGKKIERLREWRREWRRVEGVDGSRREVGVVVGSGRRSVLGSLMDGVLEWDGNDAVDGEDVDGNDADRGENGPWAETDRELDRACPNVERKGEAGCPFVALSGDRVL